MLPRSARKNDVLIIAVLCAVSVLGALQYMLLVPLLPTLPHEFATTPANVQWLVTGSILAGTIGAPILARLADMHGRKLMLVVSLSFVVLGSLLAFLATNIWVLVMARALSGLCIASVPIGISLIRTHVSTGRRILGIGLVSTTGTVGVGIALPIGGVMDALFGWRSIFLLMLLLGVALILVVMLTIPSEFQHSPGTFDVVGALLLAIGLTSVLIGISQGTEWGWLSWRIIALFLVGLLILLAWFKQQRVARFPVIDMKLSSTSSLVFANIASLGVGITAFGNILVMTSQLQVPEESGGFGLSAMMASALLSIPALTIMFTGPGASIIIGRVGAKNMLVVGGILSVLGYGMRLGFLDSLAAIVVASVVIQFGSSACLAAIPILVTSSVPVEDTAAANGVNNLVRSIGSVLASAVIGATFALTVVSDNGVVHPSEQAFRIFFVVATLSGLLIVVSAWLLPKERQFAV